MGYALTVRKHYASEVQKKKDKAKRASQAMSFVYTFRLMDLVSRMYVSCGVGFRSENEAFLKAVEMARGCGVELESLRLDKYYSTRSRVGYLTSQFGDVTVYLLPKSNSTIKGSLAWKELLYHVVNDPIGFFLEEYFQRN